MAYQRVTLINYFHSSMIRYDPSLYLRCHLSFTIKSCSGSNHHRNLSVYTSPIISFLHSPVFTFRGGGIGVGHPTCKGCAVLSCARQLTGSIVQEWEKVYGASSLIKIWPALNQQKKTAQMDLETENRLAAMLMREAAELRRQSEQEGVLAYLHKSNARTRPNSCFLTATVRGVQQANRAVEVNEMWRVRQKELELDKQAKGTTKDKSSGYKSHTDRDSSGISRRYAAFDNSLNASSSCSSKREWDECGSKDKGSSDKYYKDISNSNLSRSMSRHGNFQEPEYNPEPEGIRDEEMEEFLHTRKKRGRGGIGPRMDETGPYLPPHPDGEASPTPDARERRLIYGPERLSSGKSNESSEEELHDKRLKKQRKSHSGNSDKEHSNSKKHRSKEKSKHKKKEKRRKHRH
ncbi:protein FAM133 isoform X1 [Arachis ipaensis]|nr:protein FAM133 isoform X1 [Arachis ipaensis]XP_025633085.1 protein FAM133 isoform X1 [Arachis hypogaea]